RFTDHLHVGNADAMSRQQELIRRQIRELPPSLASVAGLPAALDTLLAPALAKRPEARYATMAAMAKAIMATHALLARDIEEGRMPRTALPGEPSVSTDPKGRSEYRRPVLVPEDEPVHITASRVVIAESAADLLATLPLGSRGGLGGTIPLPPPLPDMLRVSPVFPFPGEAPSPETNEHTLSDLEGKTSLELRTIPRRSNLSSRGAGMVIGAAFLVTGGVIAWAGAQRVSAVRPRPAPSASIAIDPGPMDPAPTTSVMSTPAPEDVESAAPLITSTVAPAAPASSALRRPASRAKSTPSAKATSAPASTFNPLFAYPRK
ncbi:MAG: hypothetical protein ACMG6S_35735, partial [Byssovorax sp.]